ncbi:hypothetical protein [Caldilinea sp.]|uniref:hypothetical protein n=1 Tax=Caldilinea sp. TaxID=2293560 RepID=UPI002CE64B53|nr:hypothetical protein [Anaerolineales bacterium]HQY92697.1 hypothetical protein [Caldilinea sp.]HRA64492.1 hypothetical protein [Caldilinea sp.]
MGEYPSRILCYLSCKLFYHLLLPLKIQNQETTARQNVARNHQRRLDKLIGAQHLDGCIVPQIDHGDKPQWHGYPGVDECVE